MEDKIIHKMRGVEDTILAAAYAIDRDTDRFERQMRYQAERDRKHGVVTLPDLEFTESGEDVAQTAIDRAMYWDTLRALDRETALFLVLRHCLGYSATEIAAGLRVSYSRVKYLCGKARKKA